MNTTAKMDHSACSILWPGFLLLFALFFSFQDPDPGATLWMIGDSTMSHKPDDAHPERGWGMFVQAYFNENLKVNNRARNGRSTRSFIYEGRWDAVLDSLKTGDFVVIQFGHNDIHRDRVERHATPAEYRYNLQKFVRETKEAGATPILCTPVMRRRFDDKGQFYDTHGEYPDIVREVAEEMEVPLIDMQRSSEEIIREAGEEGSKSLFLHFEAGQHPGVPEGLTDDTHFSESGAKQIAARFIGGVKQKVPSLASYLEEE